MTASSIIFLTFLIWTSATFAFNANYSSSPRQCSHFQVDFFGDTAVPPFQLLLIPLGGTALCVDIPPSAWDDQSKTGSFSTALPFAAGTRFIATMDGGNATETGDVSAIMEVGPPSDASCPIEPNHPPLFTLSPTVPMQCSPLSITWFSSSTPPIIRGFVPSGNPFPLDPPTASAPPNTNVWSVNVRAGTSFVLMIQNENGTLQSSELLTSAPSPDSSCLSDNSPSVTIAAADAPATSSMSGTSSTNIPGVTAPVGPARPDLGVVAGAITAGALVGILLFFALFIYIQRRRVHVQHTQRRPDLLPETQPAPFAPPIVTLPSYRRPSTASSTSSSEAPPPKRKSTLNVLATILPFTRPRTADSERRITSPPISFGSFGNRGPLPASPPRPVVMPVAFRAEPDDDLDNNRGVTFLYSGGPGLDEPAGSRSRPTADDNPPRYNTVIAPESSRQAAVPNGAKRR